jgi:chromosome segregation ATPase
LTEQTLGLVWLSVEGIWTGEWHAMSDNEPQYEDEGAEPQQGGWAYQGGDGDEHFEEVPSSEDEFDENQLPTALQTEEIKQLVAKNRVSEALIIKTAQQVLETTDRLSVLQVHKTNVRQEEKHTQLLLGAKRKEAEREQHMKQLADREKGRRKRDVSTLKKDGEYLQEQLNIAQNEIFVSNERIEQFRLEMNWAEEELLQWSLGAKQKEEDRHALEKYTKQDNLKIKNLTLRMEKLVQSVEEKKQELQDEVRVYMLCVRMCVYVRVYMCVYVCVEYIYSFIASLTHSLSLFSAHAR